MAFWSDIKRKLGMQEGLDEQELQQVKKDIANIDWNKVSQNAPVLGQDTDMMNVQGAQDVSNLTEEVNDRKSDGKLASAGLSALKGVGDSMSRSAEAMRPMKMQLGNLDQAIQGPEYGKARRQALMDMIRKG